MPQLLVLQSWPASNWLLKKNTWTNFVILDLQNYRVTVTLSHCHILLTCSVLDIFLAKLNYQAGTVVSWMPQQRESPEVSRPLPSEENKIGAFQMDSTNGSISKLSKHQWLDQKQNDSLASAGAAGVSVACKTQFWGFDALAFKEKTVLANLNSQVTTHEVCCCLQITLYSGVEIWGTKKNTP